MSEPKASIPDLGASRVLLNDFSSQWAEARSSVLSAVERTGASGWYILGKEVERFEEALAKEWGIHQAIGCASGLDALEIALRVLGLRPGEKVLTTPLSAFATTLAIVRAGGQPCFVDTDLSGLLDLDLVEKALRGDSSIRYLMPVHLYGHALDLARLEKLRDQFGLKIVEDCAQAIGARSGGRSVGTVGHFAATSFYPTKNLGAMGDAGALLTADSDLAKRARSLRDYGQSAKYMHTELGLNSRLDELHAAILNDAFLPKLRAATDRRREIANRYLRGIAHPRVQILSSPDSSDSVWHLFPLLIRGDRESFRRHLEQDRVSTAIHYPSLITAQPALNHLEARQKALIIGTLAHAERIASDEVSIPIHPFMTDKQVDRVIESCNRWE